MKQKKMDANTVWARELDLIAAEDAPGEQRKGRDAAQNSPTNACFDIELIALEALVGEVEGDTGERGEAEGGGKLHAEIADTQGIEAGPEEHGVDGESCHPQQAYQKCGRDRRLVMPEAAQHVVPGCIDDSSPMLQRLDLSLKGLLAADGFLFRLCPFLVVRRVNLPV
jgi:hypothetical protein